MTDPSWPAGLVQCQPLGGIEQRCSVDIEPSELLVALRSGQKPELLPFESTPLSAEETRRALGAASYEPTSIPAALDGFSRRHDVNEIPRRAHIDRLILEEARIRDALIAVEALGAHPLLTDAVVLLSDAQRKIADWHDGGRPGGVAT